MFRMLRTMSSGASAAASSPRSPSFTRLVAGLKRRGETITVVESCCGGLISTSIMSEPASSAVYYGGSVAYNTRRARKFLLDDGGLHDRLTGSPTEALPGESDGDAYIRSKLRWTAETAVAFCEQVGVDYAIAEGGAAGPTFRPEGMDSGFAAIAVAGRRAGDDGEEGDRRVRVLAQEVVRSTHADRVGNMRLFADAAADLAADAIGIPPLDEPSPRTMSATAAPSGTSSAGTWLDRASNIRSDPGTLRTLEDRPDARYVVLRGARECLFASPTELALLKAEDLPSDLLRSCDEHEGSTKTFLGLTSPDGAPVFAVNLEPNIKESSLPLEESSTDDTPHYFADTRTNAPLLTHRHNELALCATALAQWQRTSSFCSSCGSSQTLIHGGTCRECTGCGASSWCRQDPSIIVLVTDRRSSDGGDGGRQRALLARSRRHPPRMHTTLAGFVEAGETFERAVAREVFEETGVTVDMDTVSYVSSQPWPFPRSMMVGFRATADAGQPIRIDPDELVDAAWFDKSDVARAATVPGPVMRHDVAEKVLGEDPGLPLLIPPKGVIARALIDNWLLEDA